MGHIDISIKHAVTAFPQDWAAWLGVRPGVPVEMVESDVSTLANVTDRVLLVKEDPPFLLHLEPQGYYDAALDERMLVYAALLHRRHQLPVHSAVIALDRRAWGRKNIGGVRSESPLNRCGLQFHYEVIKVWELPVEQILAQGPGVLPLAPIAAVSADGLPAVIEQIQQRWDHEVPRAEAAELWTATFILVGLKYDRALAQLLLRGVRETMRESVTYQEIVEEGVEKGLEQGRAQAKREMVLMLGTKRLGAPDARTVAALEAVSNAAQLDAMLLRLLDARDWTEVLAARTAN